MIKFEFGSVDEMEKTLVTLGRMFSGVPVIRTTWPCPPVEAVPMTPEAAEQFCQDIKEAHDGQEHKTDVLLPTQNVVETTTITLPDAPAQNEPKAKRTRKPKVTEPEVIETPTQTVTEPEVEKQPEPEVIETPTQPAAEATKQPEPTVTNEKSTVDSKLDHSDLRIKCVQVNDSLSEKIDPTKALDKVYGVLAKYGAKAAANVPDDQIAQCYADLDALLKAPVDA